MLESACEEETSRGVRNRAVHELQGDRADGVRPKCWNLHAATQPLGLMEVEILISYSIVKGQATVQMFQLDSFGSAYEFTQCLDST